MPIPSTWTVSPSGTVISMPPITATAMISDSAWANVERVRSSSIPPNIAKAVSWAGMTHSPLRVAPPKIATTDDEDESAPAGGCQPDDGAGEDWGGTARAIPVNGAKAAATVDGGSPSSTGTRSAAVRAPEGCGQPVLVLVAGQPALGIGVADDVGHPGAVGVGDQDAARHPERAVRRVGRDRGHAHGAGTSACSWWVIRRSNTKDMNGIVPARATSTVRPGVQRARMATSSTVTR